MLCQFLDTWVKRGLETQREPILFQVWAFHMAVPAVSHELPEAGTPMLTPHTMEQWL